MSRGGEAYQRLVAVRLLMSTCNYRATLIKFDASSICCTSSFLVALSFLVRGVTWWRCYFSYELILRGAVISVRGVSWSLWYLPYEAFLWPARSVGAPNNQSLVGLT